jgi:hypothetical protein
MFFRWKFRRCGSGRKILHPWRSVSWKKQRKLRKLAVP